MTRFKRTVKRVIAGLMAVMLITGSVELPDGTSKVMADEVQTVTCLNHKQHTAECGYAEATAETPCSHEHTSECYASEPGCGKTEHTHSIENGCYTLTCENVSPNDEHTHSIENGCYTLSCETEEHTHSIEAGCYALNCTHTHDETCGYAAATEAHACEHTCVLCNGTIASLPTADAYSGLSNEEKLAAIDKLASVTTLANSLKENGTITEEEYNTLAGSLPTYPSFPLVSNMTIGNDGYPWGSGMSSSTSFTMHVDVANADGLTWQWYTASVCTTETDVPASDAFAAVDGMTGTVADNATEISLDFSYTSGNWYKCVFTDATGATKETVPIAVMSYNSRSYITNYQMAVCWKDGTTFDVIGKYDGSWLYRTAFDGYWNLYSSSEATGDSSLYVTSTRPTSTANVTALKFSFDKDNLFAVKAYATLASDQHSFAISSDVCIGSHDSAPTTAVTNREGKIMQVQLVGTSGALEDALPTDVAIVINTNVDNFFPTYAFVGRYSKRGIYINNTTDIYEEYDTFLRNDAGWVYQVQGLDSGLSVSWLNLEGGTTVPFAFNLGTVEQTGASLSATMEADMYTLTVKDASDDLYYKLEKKTGTDSEDNPVYETIYVTYDSTADQPDKYKAVYEEGATRSEWIKPTQDGDFTYTNLESNTTYRVTVKSNPGDDTEEPATDEATTAVDPLNPDDDDPDGGGNGGGNTPAEPTVTATSHTVKGVNMNTEYTYNLKKTTNGQPLFSTWKSAADGTFEFTGLEAGTKYYLVAKAADNSNSGSREVTTLYDVIFSTNGKSTDWTTSKETCDYNSGDKVSAPSETPKAYRYKFAGWYKDSSCTTAWNFASDTVTANTTLYAKWEDHTHTVNYIVEDDNPDILLAYCTSDSSCRMYGSASNLANAVPLKIKAVDSFDESPTCPASLPDTTAWTEAGLTLPTIYYVGTGETTYEDSADYPRVNGTYRAYIKVGDATAYADFKVKASTTYTDVTLTCKKMVAKLNQLTAISSSNVTVQVNDTTLTSDQYTFSCIAEEKAYTITFTNHLNLTDTVSVKIAGEGILVNGGNAYTKTVDGHELTYTSKTNTLTAACLYCNVSAAISVNASDTVYAGSPVTATLSDTTDWTAIGIAVPDIYYEGADDTIYTKSTTAPSAAGAYAATISVGGATAVALFEITQEELSASSLTTVPTLITGLVYNGADTLNNGTAQTLITPGTSDTYTIRYRIGDDGEWSSVIPQGTDAGDYTIYYQIIGDANHLGVESEPLGTSTIAKQALSAPAAPTVASKNAANITLNAITATEGQGKVLYAKNTTNQAPTDSVYWQESPTFTGLTPNTTYYFFAKYAGSDNYSESPASASVSDTTPNKNVVTPTGGPVDGDPTTPDPDEPKVPYEPDTNPDDPDCPKPEAPKDPDYDPEDFYEPCPPSFPDGTPTQGDPVVTYTYEGREGTIYPNTTVKPVAVGKYYLVITVEDEINFAETRVPFEITKVNPDNIKKSAFTVINETIEAKNDGRISLPEDEYSYEYSLDGENFTDITGDGLSGLSDGTVYIRRKASDNYNASNVVSLTVGAGIQIKQGESFWYTLLNTLTFNHFFKETQTVSVEKFSEINGISSIYYYVSTTGTAMGYDDLAAVSESEWKRYPTLGVRVNPDNNYVVYFRVTDTLNNITYLSTDAMILDATAPVIAGVEDLKTYTSVDGTKTFTVEEAYLSKVVLCDVSGNETIMTNDSVTGQKYTYTITSPGTYTVTAVDKAGNQSKVSDFTIKTGQTEPIPGNPTYDPTYDPTTPDDPGTPIELPEGVPDSTYGPFKVPDEDGDPIIHWYYDPDDPGEAYILLDDPDEYEIYRGPLGPDGEPTGGRIDEDDYPAKIPTGTPVYIRRKGKTVPTPTEPSNYIPYTIPNADVSTVYVEVYAANTGSVEIPTGLTYKTVYSGKTVTIKAEPATGYTFVKWIRKADATTLTTNTTYEYTTSAPETNVVFQAVFEKQGNKIVSVPIFTPVRRYTYDGTTKYGISETEVPAHTDFAQDSVTSATDARTYTFTLTLASNYTWADGTTAAKTYSWIIDKADTNPPTAQFFEDRKDIVVAGVPEGRKIQYKYGENGTVEELEDENYFYPTSDETVDGNIVTGTYYVRIEGDSNHKPSAWVAVIVGSATPVISYNPPTDFTLEPVGVTVHTKLSTTDDVKKVIIRYRKQGSTTWTETEISPISTLIDLSLPTLGTMDEDTVYEYQTVATAEGLTEGSDDDIVIEGEIETFKTGKSYSDNTPTGQITTVVNNNDTTETKNVTVTIEEGNTKIASATASVGAGESVTIPAFTGLPDGTYNIVMRTSDGKFTETKIVTIEDGSSQTATFNIKPGELSSVVDVVGDAPNIAVGGLPDIFTSSDLTAASTGSESVEVKLEVEKKDESTAEGASQLKNLADTIYMYLNLSLYKTTKELDATGEITSSETVDIGSTNSNVLEVAVPYDSAAYSNVTVLRYHDGVETELTKLDSKPYSGYADGTFYADSDYVYIFGSGYSTYALAKGTTKSGGNGGNGGNGGGSSGGSGNGDSGNNGSSEVSNSSSTDYQTTSGLRANPPYTGELPIENNTSESNTLPTSTHADALIPGEMTLRKKEEDETE